MPSLSGVQVHSDRWCSVRDGDLEVHARIGLNDQKQVVITDLLVSGAEITTDTLRRLYPARILAGLTTNALPMELHLEEEPTSFYLSGAALLNMLARLAGDDANLTIGELHQRATDELEPAERPALGRPNGSSDFYATVAEAYRSAATDSGKPAVLLAKENNVPVETVRRWIKETRRRGYLPPGRQGRAQ